MTILQIQTQSSDNPVAAIHYPHSTLILNPAWSRQNLSDANSPMVKTLIQMQKDHVGIQYTKNVLLSHHLIFKNGSAHLRHHRAFTDCFRTNLLRTLEHALNVLGDM